MAWSELTNLFVFLKNSLPFGEMKGPALLCDGLIGSEAGDPPASLPF